MQRYFTWYNEENQIFHAGSAFSISHDLKYSIFHSLFKKLTLNIFSTTKAQKAVEQVRLKFANIYKTIHFGEEKTGQIKHIYM